MNKGIVPLILGLNVVLEVFERDFDVALVLSSEVASRLDAGAVVNHMERNRATSLRPSANMIELKTHECLDEGCTINMGEILVLRALARPIFKRESELGILITLIDVHMTCRYHKATS